jgi:hypothetical protein
LKPHSQRALESPRDQPTLPKIALEEHFAIEETLGDSKQFMPEDQWSELRAPAKLFRLA